MAKIDHVPLKTAAKQAAQLQKAAKMAEGGAPIKATRSELVKASALVNRERAWGSK